MAYDLPAAVDASGYAVFAKRPQVSHLAFVPQEGVLFT
jgi:hypothetical protein